MYHLNHDIQNLNLNLMATGTTWSSLKWAWQTTEKNLIEKPYQNNVFAVCCIICTECAEKEEMSTKLEYLYISFALQLGY